jgi:hypothetical protein
VGDDHPDPVPGEDLHGIEGRTGQPVVVQPYGAMILGILASVFCYMAIQVKNRLGYDDSLDAFGIHGIGGIVGALFLSFLIRPSFGAHLRFAFSKSNGTFTRFHCFYRFRSDNKKEVITFPDSTSHVIRKRFAKRHFIVVKLGINADITKIFIQLVNPRISFSILKLI